MAAPQGKMTVEQAAKVLGMPSGANLKDETLVKRAYHRMAKQCHPDKNVGNTAEATRVFQQIGQARSKLMKHARGEPDSDDDDIDDAGFGFGFPGGGGPFGASPEEFAEFMEFMMFSEMMGGGFGGADPWGMGPDDDFDDDERYFGVHGRGGPGGSFGSDDDGDDDGDDDFARFARAHASRAFGRDSSSDEDGRPRETPMSREEMLRAPNHVLAELKMGLPPGSLKPGNGLMSAKDVEDCANFYRSDHGLPRKYGDSRSGRPGGRPGQTTGGSGRGASEPHQAKKQRRRKRGGKKKKHRAAAEDDAGVPAFTEPQSYSKSMTREVLLSAPNHVLAELELNLPPGSLKSGIGLMSAKDVEYCANVFREKNGLPEKRGDDGDDAGSDVGDDDDVDGGGNDDEEEYDVEEEDTLHDCSHTFKEPRALPKSMTREVLLSAPNHVLAELEMDLPPGSLRPGNDLMSTREVEECANLFRSAHGLPRKYGDSSSDLPGDRRDDHPSETTGSGRGAGEPQQTKKKRRRKRGGRKKKHGVAAEGDAGAPAQAPTAAAAPLGADAAPHGDDATSPRGQAPPRSSPRGSADASPREAARAAAPSSSAPAAAGPATASVGSGGAHGGVDGGAGGPGKPLQLLFTAVLLRDVAACRELLQREGGALANAAWPSHVRYPDINADIAGFTALHLCVRQDPDRGSAAFLGDATSAQLAESYGTSGASLVPVLLENGADPAALDAKGLAALHVAASNGDVDCLRALLAWSEGRRGGGGAFHVDMVGRNGHQGYTALHFAALSGWPECVQLLLSRGAAVALRTPEGDRPSDLCTKALQFLGELTPAVRKRIARCLVLLDREEDSSSDSSDSDAVDEPSRRVERRAPAAAPRQPVRRPAAQQQQQQRNGKAEAKPAAQRAVKEGGDAPPKAQRAGAGAGAPAAARAAQGPVRLSQRTEEDAARELARMMRAAKAPPGGGGAAAGARARAAPRRPAAPPAGTRLAGDADATLAAALAQLGVSGF